MQGDTPVPIGSPREHGLGEVTGQLVQCIDAALDRAQDLNRYWGNPPVLQEPLMGRRIVGPDKGLVHLFKRCQRGRQGELVVVAARTNWTLGSP